MRKFEIHYPLDRWTVTQKFGGCAPAVCQSYKNLGLNGHNGEDLVATTGTVLRAAHDGMVTFAGDDGSGGWGIVIRTEDKRTLQNKTDTYPDGIYMKSIYWHLLPSALYVKAGQKVNVGDIIALTDNTGMSTGPHLHFGIKPMYKGEQDWEWWNAEQDNGYKGAIDPAPYWSGLYAKDYASIRTQLQAITIKVQQLLQSNKG